MLIGYACISTQDKRPVLQFDTLQAVSCDRVLEEMSSSAQRDRPELQAAIDDARPGETLVIWKLERLVRLTKQLIEAVDRLEAGTSASAP